MSGDVAVGSESTVDILEKMGIPGRPGVAWAHVFPARFSLTTKPKDEDVSILVVTETGEVFGKGINSLVGFYHKSPLPMKPGCGADLKEFTKLKQFSGLKMKKILVGVGFGVGLTEDNELYMWGGGPPTKKLVEPSETVIFRGFRKGKCFCGSNHEVKLKEEGGFELACCLSLGGYYGPSPKFSVHSTNSPPPPGEPTRVFALSRYLSGLCCQECGTYCNERSLEGKSLYYCNKCGSFQEVCYDVPHPAKEMAVPRRILSGVRDVDCGALFVCVSHGPCRVSILRWIETGDMMSHSIHESVVTPSYLTVSSFSCGSAHLAVLTSQRDLYTYGDGQGESIGAGEKALQPVFMKKVLGNPAAVKKVSCGSDTTLCLLADYSVWLINKGVQQVVHSVLQNSPLDLGQDFFTDVIGCIHMKNQFFLEEKPQSVWSVLINEHRKVKVTRCDNDYSALFVAQKMVQSMTGGKSALSTNKSHPHRQTSTKPEQNLVKPVSKQTVSKGQSFEQKDAPKTVESKQEELKQPKKKVKKQPSGLYGKTLLSDLTLKLADGDFPAHSHLLFVASNYFRELFIAKGSAPKELDVSSYNAKAYKTLLQYLYKETPDVIGLRDLIDLYSLASSYNEASIFETVSTQLKALDQGPWWTSTLFCPFWPRQRPTATRPSSRHVKRSSGRQLTTRKSSAPYYRPHQSSSSAL